MNNLIIKHFMLNLQISFINQQIIFKEQNDDTINNSTFMKLAVNNNNKV